MYSPAGLENTPFKSSSERLHMWASLKKIHSYVPIYKWWISLISKLSLIFNQSVFTFCRCPGSNTFSTGARFPPHICETIESIRSTLDCRNINKGKQDQNCKHSKSDSPHHELVPLFWFAKVPKVRKSILWSKFLSDQIKF